MTQYLVLLPSPEPRYATATPEELQELNQAHNDFVELIGQRGHKMVGGAQLAPSSQASVARGTALDQVTLTEGPYAESAEQVGGYYLVETDDVRGPRPGVRPADGHAVPPGHRDPSDRGDVRQP